MWLNQTRWWLSAPRYDHCVLKMVCALLSVWGTPCRRVANYKTPWTFEPIFLLNLLTFQKTQLTSELWSNPSSQSALRFVCPVSYPYMTRKTEATQKEMCYNIDLKVPKIVLGWSTDESTLKTGIERNGLVSSPINMNHRITHSERFQAISSHRALSNMEDWRRARKGMLLKMHKQTERAHSAGFNTMFSCKHVCLSLRTCSVDNHHTLLYRVKNSTLAKRQTAAA